MTGEVFEADALADLQRVADHLDHPPTVAEYRKHGEYSVPTVASHYDGSFTAARAAALDCADERQAEISREQLLADIEQVAETVGQEPSKDDYKEHGEHALSTVTYRFESWIVAKKAADVYDGLDEGPTREELLADLQRVDEEYSSPVSKKRYRKYGKWTEKPIRERFGGWEDACQEAGVSRPGKGPQTAPTEELFGDIRRVADELGRAPTKTEYNDRGRFSQQMAKSRVGSWSEALRKAGFEPRTPGGQSGKLNGNWKGGYDPYYGQNWYRQRRAARKRDGYECVACGMADEAHIAKYGWELEVHHIKPVRTFDIPEEANELSNLITLCRPHHREYEHLPAERAKELMDSA